MAQPEYPKIIRRPVKPPEEYAYLDVSVIIPSKPYRLYFFYLMRTNPLLLSPFQKSNAIEKWGKMRETTVEHFKFTPRTSAYAFIWALALPFGIYSLIKWHRRRKYIRKGLVPKV